ncbi:hypothetical protein [Neisseria sicca]|uniref:hypothetical protein n=1 Tax=Neisseria sicca TaxID=490 RepID=UPI0016497ED8|nr:hypothetical protein [Neisseria sicca]
MNCLINLNETKGRLKTKILVFRRPFYLSDGHYFAGLRLTCFIQANSSSKS